MKNVGGHAFILFLYAEYCRIMHEQLVYLHLFDANQWPHLHLPFHLLGASGDGQAHAPQWGSLHVFKQLDAFLLIGMNHNEVQTPCGGTIQAEVLPLPSRFI